MLSLRFLYFFSFMIASFLSSCFMLLFFRAVRERSAQIILFLHWGLLFIWFYLIYFRAVRGLNDSFLLLCEFVQTLCSYSDSFSEVQLILGLFLYFTCPYLLIFTSLSPGNEYFLCSPCALSVTWCRTRRGPGGSAMWVPRGVECQFKNLY